MKRILVAGAGGFMGKNYLNVLLGSDLHFPQSDLVLVEANRERAGELTKQCPHSTVYEKISEVSTEEPIDAAFVLTNSASHYAVILELVDKGVRNFFVEKPLVPSGKDGADLIRNLPKDAKIFTGYLLTFSGAFNALAEFMRKESLVVLEAFGDWGKDRFGDPRPTAGNLDDESVHAMSVLFALSRINQSPVKARLTAKLSHLSFAQMETSARQEMPISSTFIVGNLIMEANIPVAFGIRSSFLKIRYTNKFQAVLGDMDSRQPRYLVEVNFDVPGGDTLEIKDVGFKIKEPRLSTHTDNKILGQLRAFFGVVDKKSPDPRLTDLARALEILEFTEAARRSQAEPYDVVLNLR